MSNGACTSPAELVRIPFTLAAPGARSVSVVLFLDPFAPALADLSRPEPFDRLPPLITDVMRLAQVAPGLWRAEIDLRPGRCEYSFLVDGKWVPDPEAADSCPDGAGGRNSLVNFVRARVPAAALGRRLPPHERARELLRAV